MKIRKHEKRISSWLIDGAVCLSFVFTLFVPAALCQTENKDIKKTPFRIPRMEKKIFLDGKLDDDVWQEALLLEMQYEVWPGENIKAPVKTEALLAYNRTHLFVGFRAYDPDPSAIRARICNRDNIAGDDCVGVALCTFNDNQRIYSFCSNPLGIQDDEIRNNDGEGGGWDGIWESKGKITDWGYAVEMAIPFSSLRFQRTREDQVWSFDLVRTFPRNVTHYIGFIPQDRNNNCYICQTEKLIGFSGVSRAKNLEIDPTLSGLLTRNRESFPEGKFIEKDSKFEPGITAHWSFTPNLTLSATANPDFSNVEADVAQLDVNTQFALFYPEKRPFFLEGASIFNTLLSVIYTRTLLDPNGGIKLTGKEGRHGVGFFSVHDNITNLLIPGSQSSNWTSLDTRTLGTVLRYRMDIGKASGIGLVLSDREGDDYFNRLAGMDGDFRLARKDRVVFQFLGSQTRYPGHIVNQFGQPEDEFQGMAFNLNYAHRTATFNWVFDYEDITPDFRADLGFLPQVGYRHISGLIYHTWHRNFGSWYTFIHLGPYYIKELDYDGNLLQENLVVFFRYNGPVQSFFNVDANFGKKSYLGVEFDNNFISINTGFQSLKALVFKLSARFGDQVDFANIRLGEIFSITPQLELKLGSHLYTNLGHNFEKLEVEGGRLYTANLTNLKLVYQFNKRTFLRTILQYADYRFNSGLYLDSRDPRYRNLFSQILFSYTINPQTVLFLGYSDDYYGYQFIPLTQNNYTIFMKIGYALRL